MAEDDSDIHHAHDKLFKAGFSDPSTAAAFLQSQLSPAIVSRIDWPRLQLQPGSFIDSHFIQLAEIPFEDIRGTPAGILILRT
ncbi:MAG: Rpn family recombination-promoting nuclease/putative transposase, partial [Verrucomicrobiales bacterium]|nr:Rpn family recombination-promoting nuclease/putative transposase [Verrucomicrobiales bacterium]